MSMEDERSYFRETIAQQNTRSAFRFAFAKDAAHGRRVMEHEANALVAEYRLSTDGIKPELLAYLEGIGKERTG